MTEEKQVFIIAEIFLFFPFYGKCRSLFQDKFTDHWFFSLQKTVLANLEKEMLKCDNKCRFIQGVVDGSIIVSNRKRADLFRELKEKGFTPLPKKENASEVAVAASTDEAVESVGKTDIAKGQSSSDYDYLISLAIGTLTLEKIQELLAERDKLVQEVEDLKQTSVKSLWMRDLDALEAKVIEVRCKIMYFVLFWFSSVFQFCLYEYIVQDQNKYLIKWEADRKRIQGATVSGPSQKNPRKKNQKTGKKESSGEQMEVSETVTETGWLNRIPYCLIIEIC